MRHDVVIIDSGGANIASLVFALERLGQRAELTKDARTIAAAERVILPGVGAARNAIERLAADGLLDTVRALEQPVLGVCLGMQLLAEASEENDVECLGLLSGTARRLPVLPGFPVPNMGWCPVQPTASHPLLAGIDARSWFYFVHSYALPVNDQTLATAVHGTVFSAMAAERNFAAAQFHPERSAGAGARLLANFLAWNGCE